MPVSVTEGVLCRAATTRSAQPVCDQHACKCLCPHSRLDAATARVGSSRELTKDLTSYSSSPPISRRARAMGTIQEHVRKALAKAEGLDEEVGIPLR